MDIIKDYLNSTNSNTIDLKILLRLYSNYSKIAKIDYNKLKRYEDDVYTIKNEKMSDSERIIKEIDIIKTALKKFYLSKVDHVYFLLNININFYNASCDAFIDIYKEIENTYNKKRIL